MPPYLVRIFSGTKFLGSGAVIAVIMEMLGVPALIFALGMYLPLELNTPALVPHVARHIAELKGLSVEAVAEATRRNFAHLFVQTQLHEIH